MLASEALKAILGNYREGVEVIEIDEEVDADEIRDHVRSNPRHTVIFDSENLIVVAKRDFEVSA